MRLNFRRIFRNAAIGVTTLGALLAGTVLVRQHRTFDAPYPDLHASQDPAVIARGKYLAYGLAHCVDCHGDPRQRKAKEAGELIELSGGHEWRLPFGTVYSKNITPDPETGIGRYTDPEIARILRYAVHADGRAVLPFMPFADLTDDDLVALISFLRSQKPVRRELPKDDINFLGSTVLAFLIEPKGPTQTPVHSLPPSATPEYGRYLANSVGNCVKCHTKIDMKTGELAAVPFSGGAQHESETAPGKVFVSPNLTPDPNSGWINEWSEDMFVARMHAGPIQPDSPMPWRSFSRITDDDARALFRYLRSLPAASGGPNPKDLRTLASNVTNR
jgi:mono/diheme cytochrome c family protein